MNTLVLQFEKKLSESGWHIDKSLQECIHDIESLWVHSECTDLLKWVKDVVKDPSMFLSELVDCGSVPSAEGKVADNISNNLGAALTLPKCKVSKVAYLLVTKIQRILQEGAIISIEPSSNMLYACVRNALDLYRMLLARNLTEKVREVPQFAAVYYTDFMYIAHVLSYSALQYS
jgi:hypothetical protein